jgi:diguanylate cyclase (GGDEF)-like protein/PAS domain S-box-containing protein
MPSNNLKPSTDQGTTDDAFYRLFDFVPIPMLIAEEMKLEGKVRSVHKYYNRKFHQVIGYTLEDVPDMDTWYQTAYPDPKYREEVITAFDQAVQEMPAKGENIVTTMSKVRCKDGTEHWFEIIGELRSSIKEHYHVAAFLEVTELKATMAELDRLSQTDALTHLLNRRGLFYHFEKEMSRAQRTGRSFSIILCDIDHFKRINDTYGHDCGDQVLVSVASLIQKTLRENDLVARWGGEEFYLLLPETELTSAHTLADRIKSSLAEVSCSYGGISLSPTMTFGIAGHAIGASMDEILRRADMALYYGKTKGRNRIVVYDPDTMSLPH